MKRLIIANILLLASIANASPLIQMHSHIKDKISDAVLKDNLEIQYWTDFYYVSPDDPREIFRKELAFNSKSDEVVADLRFYPSISTQTIQIAGLSQDKNGTRVDFGSFIDGSCSSRKGLNPNIFDRSGTGIVTVTATKISNSKYDLHCEFTP